MGRRLIYVLALICSFYCSRAQLNPDSSNTHINDLSVLPGKLYAQLANAIKPSSFLSASQNEGKALVTDAGNTSDPAGIGRSLASLTGYIKQDLFKTSFNAAGFKSSAAKVTTSGQLATILKDFESGIKPTALSDLWKMQKANWTSDLKNLK